MSTYPWLKICLSLFLVLLCLFGQSQSYDDLKLSIPRYVTGFKTIRIDNQANETQRTSNINDVIEFDIWYPANKTRKSRPLKFQFFFKQQEARLKKSQSGTDWNGYDKELAAYLESLSKNHETDLKQVETATIRNATMSDNNFPLILYFTSEYNLSFENIKLFEYLSSRGFVIAAVGPANFEVGRKNADDVLTEVNDAMLVLQYLRKQSIIDSTKVAAIGWGSGGLSVVLAAMLTEGLNAVVSIDGDEVHYYHPAGSDHKLHDLMSSKRFRPQEIEAPFLHLGSDQDLQFLLEIDSVYSPLPELSGSNYYIRFDELGSSEMSPFNYLGSGTRTPVSGQGFHNIQNVLVLNFLNKAFENDMTTFSEILENHLISQPDGMEVFLPQTTYDPFEIRGVVVDADNLQPISFPKVQISNYDLGVLGNSNGEFRLNYLESHQQSMTTITSPGYETKKMGLEELWAQSGDSLVIKVSKKAIVRHKNDTIKNLPKTLLADEGETAKYFSSEFVETLKGQELGVVFDLGRNPARLEKLEFRLKSNSTQKIILRPNIYTIKRGIPHENITPDNLLLEITVRSGKFTIDLEKYNLLLSNDIFVSLELLEVIGDNSDISFASSLSGKDSYAKNISNNRWIKYKGLSPAFELTVTYVNNDEGQYR